MVETVASSSKFVALVDRARAGGMRFGLIYVTVRSDALNMARVAQRAADGGHDVPADRILARRAASIANFPGFARRADAGLVLDNTVTDLVTYDPQPRILAEKRFGEIWRVLDPVTAPYLTDALADLG